MIFKACEWWVLKIMFYEEEEKTEDFWNFTEYCLSIFSYFSIFTAYNIEKFLSCFRLVISDFSFCRLKHGGIFRIFVLFFSSLQLTTWWPAGWLTLGTGATLAKCLWKGQYSMIRWWKRSIDRIKWWIIKYSMRISDPNYHPQVFVENYVIQTDIIHVHVFSLRHGCDVEHGLIIWCWIRFNDNVMLNMV